MRFFLPFLWAGLLLAQQPILYNRGAVNAASLAPPGLPNGGIAAGSLFSVFGENLGPAAVQSASTFPLGTTFQNVSISVTQGGVTTAAYPIFVSPTQVNAVMPSSVTPGIASMRLTYQTKQSNAIAIRIANSSPGIFAFSAGGFGPGIVQNYSSSGVPTLNSLTNPAYPGQTVVIWATGLGPVTFPDNVAASAGNVATAVTVAIGGQNAVSGYSGRAPGDAGVDQINVAVPTNVPLGCWVPVTINAGGVVSNTATMAIAAPGAASCNDSANPLSTLVRTPGTQGVIAITQSDDVNNINTSTTDKRSFQEVYSRFYTRADSPFNFDPYFSYPPAGTCLVHQASGDASKGLTLRGALAATASLNPQPNQTFNNGSQSVKLSVSSPFYDEILGVTAGGEQLGLTPPTTGASFTIDPGGVNQKVLALTPEPAPAWNRPSGITVIPRAASLALSFAPSDAAAPTAIVIYAYAAATNSTVEVQCLAAPGATTFTISPDTLANLPASYRILDGSYATLAIGTLGLNSAVSFTNGLATSGVLLDSNWLSEEVVIQ